MPKKILVVSDTHGMNRYLQEAIRQEKEFDLLVHCGDVEENLDYILDEDLRKRTYCVQGNCDYYSYPQELVLLEEGSRILVVHGHRHRAGRGTEELVRAARMNQADVVLYGHSHVPDIDYAGGILLVNPGSIARPRQFSRARTYAVLNLCEGRLPRADIKELSED